MTRLENIFDPELLQGKWVLGGVGPEQLVQFAILALERGYDGPALRQLAGLSQANLRDVGNLPAHAFAEMGLKPMGLEEAASVLAERGEPSRSPAITSLQRVFPDFSHRWKIYISDCGGNSPGSYIEMAEFVHFVVEELYERGKLDETRRVFRFLEELLVNADQETRNLIGLGFFETLQNVASRRPGGNEVYEQFLGPMSQQVWSEIQKMWAGKSSLMDVIRAEAKANDAAKS